MRFTLTLARHGCPVVTQTAQTGHEAASMALALRRLAGEVRGERAIARGYEWQGVRWTLRLIDADPDPQMVSFVTGTPSQWTAEQMSRRRHEARRKWAARALLRRGWGEAHELSDARILARRSGQTLTPPHRPALIRAARAALLEQHTRGSAHAHLPHAAGILASLAAHAALLGRVLDAS